MKTTKRAAMRHGSSLRGLESVPHSSTRDARFGRMFRNLPAADFPESALHDLATTMIQGEFADRIAKGKPVDTPLNKIEAEDENPAVPAGYTYLGQFIDHDITFDPASSLDRFNDPEALRDFRTPRLDLDSVYGSGPDDQPFLYAADGAHLLLGDDKDFNGSRKRRPDLPRNTAKPRRALVGDKRNDENVIVGQLHTLFLRFHNAVLDHVSGGTIKPGDFAKAQQVVRWHYQWIVLHDFLKRILGPDTYKRVIVGPGEAPVIRYYVAKGNYAFMPVEFSVAAYRFGHSMVRPSYALNSIVIQATPSEQPFMGQKAKFHRIPIFSLVDIEKQPLANLNGFRELPGFWAIDWAFFFPNIRIDGSVEKGAVLPQPSYKIDTVLVDPLASLPDHQDQPSARRALAALNLLRGWRLGLPSGQAVARRMGLEPLSDKQIFDHADKKRKAARAALLKNHPGVFEDNAPLWFYILREAELSAKSAHLGPVGGTIVGEVIAGLILEDRQSFLSVWPKWRPMLPSKTAGLFTMADLANFVNAAEK